MHYEFPPALKALAELNEREQATDALLKPGNGAEPVPAWAHAMLKNQRVLLRTLAGVIGPPLAAAVEAQQRQERERIIKPSLVMPSSKAPN